MTGFLRVGFLEERLVEIARAAEYATALLEMNDEDRSELLARLAKEGVAADLDDEICRVLRVVAGLARDSARFLGELPCQPLLYTGSENTDTVINHLERLLREQPVVPRRQRRGA